MDYVETADGDTKIRLEPMREVRLLHFDILEVDFATDELLFVAEQALPLCYIIMDPLVCFSLCWGLVCEVTETHKVNAQGIFA